jgi:hypothetical protein
MSKSMYGQCFISSLLLGEYLGVERLDCIVGMCLIFQEIEK